MSLKKEVEVILIIDGSARGDRTKTHRFQIEIRSDAKGATFADFREFVGKQKLGYIFEPSLWLLEIFDRSKGIYTAMDTVDYYSEVILDRSQIRAQLITPECKTS